ncbi:hypothetical protein D4T97_002465 [Siminovitchia acidinfaciens]|uniref:Uncharacterized protein n=1 Tax=Siminovitchia acidinfaciens TaxID=2321395 RepID=A0A429Y7G6_9BACI|nr:Imm64 family immunity protein [Siminovitchia acidinfaciens]RST77371.1 hypothetical protein D4T97_002465 [Siminovitchia acidinfaciens]
MSSGGDVNIGMVFTEEKGIFVTWSKMKSYIIKNGGQFKKLKYSKDMDGENWIQLDIKDNSLDESFLTGYYPELELSRSSLGLNTERIHLSIEKDDGYFGFLFGIEWDSLFSKEVDVAKIRNHMVATLTAIYETIPFAYSFIGHEIEIDSSPDEFEDLIAHNDSYPVALIESKDGLDIYYGNIGIDGISGQIPKKDSVTI